RDAAAADDTHAVALRVGFPGRGLAFMRRLVSTLALLAGVGGARLAVVAIRSLLAATAASAAPRVAPRGRRPGAASASPARLELVEVLRAAPVRARDGQDAEHTPDCAPSHKSPSPQKGLQGEATRLSANLHDPRAKSARRRRPPGGSALLLRELLPDP